jgi:hypothetical protein
MEAARGREGPPAIIGSPSLTGSCLAVYVHEPGVASCRAGKSPAELEMLLIEHAVGEEFARAASTAEAPCRHQIDHFLDGSPLVGGHAGIQLRELAAKAGLTPLRHAADSPTRAGPSGADLPSETSQATTTLGRSRSPGGESDHLGG